MNNYSFAFFKLIVNRSLGEVEEVVQDYQNYTVPEFWKKYMGYLPVTRKQILNVKLQMKQYTLGRYR